MIDKTRAATAQDEAFTDELKNLFRVMRMDNLDDPAGAAAKFEKGYRKLLKDDSDARAVIDSATPG